MGIEAQETIASEETSAREDQTPLDAFADGGRFSIGAPLGSGAMGTVLRARDSVRRHDVALKLLTQLQPEAIYRFKQEFRGLSDIVHPNLVTLYGLHHIGESWALSMELVDDARSMLDFVRPYSHLLAERRAETASTGPSAPVDHRPDEDMTATVGLETANATAATMAGLASGNGAGPSTDKRRAIADAALMPGRLYAACSQLVAGVDALHQFGILHRDLKPSNVLVDGVGRLVVCDFGLATRGAGTAGRFAGTPAYASPEQALGQELTPASDWYSVGVMMYEAITGQLPVSGATADEMLGRKATAQVTPIAELVPDADERLAQVVMELLSVDPGARPGAERLRTLLGQSKAVLAPVRRTDDSVFVGRREECERLRAALTDTRHGRSVTMLVRGVSGVGKSSLIRHMVAEWTAQHDAIVVAGRCYENELVAFKALDGVVDALAELLLDFSDQEARAFLDASVASLATLFPVLRRVGVVARLMAALPEATDDGRLLGTAAQGLRCLLGNLAKQRPVVVVIDDLQWGDLDSAVFLRELADGDAVPGVLVVATHRSEQGDPPLVEALRQAAGAAGQVRDLRVLDVPPLPNDDAIELVRQIAGAGADVDARSILRDAGGSPLFVAELAHARAGGTDSAAGAGAGDGGLDGLIARRLGELGADARSLLDIVALAGRPRRASMLARAARVEDEAGALAELRAGRFVRVEYARDGELLAPYHDRIRETAASILDDDQRRSLHRRLARALEQDSDRDVDGLVEHWLAAGDRGKAGRYALEAADRAFRARAHRRAAEHLRTALDLCKLNDAQRFELTLWRANSLWSAGSVLDAAAAYRAAAELSGPERGAELLGQAMVCLLRASRMVEAAELAKDLGNRLGLRIPRTMPQALGQVAWQRTRLLRGVRVRRLTAAGDCHADVLGTMDRCREISTALGFTATILGYAVHSRFLADALAYGEPLRVIDALCMETAYLTGLKGARARKARARLIGAAREIALDRAPPAYAHVVDGWEAFSGYLYYEKLHEIGAALERAADGAEVEPSQAWQADIFRLYGFNGLAIGGDLAHLKRRLPAMLRRAQERGNQYLADNIGRQAGSYVWLAQDRPDAALELFDRSRPPDTREPTLDHFYADVIRGEVELYSCDPREAWQRMGRFAHDIRWSSMGRIPAVVVWTAQALAKAAIMSAIAYPSERPRFLAAAKKLARRIRRRRAAFPLWADALVPYIHAMVADVEGDEDRCVEALRVALPRLDGCARMWSIPARMVLARKVGGDEAARLRQSASEWFAEQEIANPERFVYWSCPTLVGRNAGG